MDLPFSGSQPQFINKGGWKSLYPNYETTQKNSESVSAADPSLLASAGLENMYLYQNNGNKTIFSLPQEAIRGWRSRPSSWWPSSLLILDKFCLLTLISAEAQALCRYFGWGLHIKAQISAAKEENHYKYLNHSENEKEMDRNQRTQHLNSLETNQAFADFKGCLGYLI